MKISVTVLLATSSLILANLYACSNGSTLPISREKKQGSVTDSDVKSGGETPVQNGPNGGIVTSPKDTPGTSPKDTPGGCADAKSIADPNATFVFEKPVGGDPWDICTGIVGGQQWCGRAQHYLSEFMGENARKINPSITMIMGWSPSGDNVTASTLCHLKGYSTVAAYDTPKTTKSVLYWDPVSRSFAYRFTKKTEAERAPYLGLLSLTCKGKLIDSCISDQSWIYGKK